MAAGQSAECKQLPFKCLILNRTSDHPHRRGRGKKVRARESWGGKLGRAVFWAWDGYCTHGTGHSDPLHKTSRPASRRGWGRGYGQLMAAGEKGVIVLSDEATSEVSVLMQAVLVKPRVTEQNSSKRR